ncbi:MAG TPA: hypothetical protein VJ255_12830, partial [Candidatus Acidoferrum sp.]|nr:hypothetical protein [Candidatus Acidoferrum sp.]
MHLHSYRDEDRSRHLDLIGGRGHPWSIDLVAAIASALLLVGFGCALIAVWVHAARVSPPRCITAGRR